MFTFKLDQKFLAEQNISFLLLDIFLYSQQCNLYAITSSFACRFA